MASKSSNRAGYGQLNGAKNPTITNSSVNPKFPRKRDINVRDGNIEQYDGTSWNQIGGTVLLASGTNSGNETLSGTALTLIEKTINATTNKTYLLNFCAKVGSAGSTSFSVYVDDVLIRSYTFDDDTINFSKLLTLAAGARVIKIKASGTGTIAAGDSELGVYL
jgi:hypothetical protein